MRVTAAIPTAPRDMAAYWKQYYNTPLGAGSVDEFIANWDRQAPCPGKPIWFGWAGPRPVLGLPGNPASALVCAHLFLRPMLEALLGRSPAAGHACGTRSMPVSG